MDTAIPASEIEARIRDEAERKIAAVHTLKEIHNEIVEEREAFLTHDSERRRRLGDAIAQAKKAGFSDNEVKDWRVDPIGSNKSKQGSRRGVSRKRAGDRGSQTEVVGSSAANTETSEDADTGQPIGANL